jgi:hypothetical protein
MSFLSRRAPGRPERDVVTTSRPSPVLQLPNAVIRQGRYGLRMRAARDVEVRRQVQRHWASGRSAEAALDRRRHPAMCSGMRDETGHVWTTGQSEPSVILQAGRYVVRAKRKRPDRQ